MKLHLPKRLQTAVIAACMVPAAYAYTLNTGVNNVLQQNETINDTQQLDGNVEINGKGYSGGYPEGYSLTLESGANVDITGTLKIESQLHMTIQDEATLTASGNLILGHDEDGHPADLTMVGGNLTVASILFHENNANKVTITGGTLTITGSEAISQDGRHAGQSTLSIGGTDDKSVTLKTGSSAVTFDYAPLQLGNVKIAADNTQTITITNATLNGVITNEAGADKLVLSGNNTLGENVVDSVDKYYTDDAFTTESSSGNGYLLTTVSANIGNNLTFAESATFTYGELTLAYDQASGACQTTITDTRTYYVNNDAAYSSDMASAAHISVAENATLTASGINAGTILLNALGTGTITIDTNTTIAGNTTAGTYATSAFAGTVNVTGGQLSIGSNGTGINNGWKVQAENMIINLDGGNLYYFGYDSDLGDLTVAQNANYVLHASWKGNDAHTVSHKKLSIARGATLTIGSNYEASLTFTDLKGDGTLNLENRDPNNQQLDIIIDNVDFNGNITQAARSTLTMKNVTKVGTITNTGGTLNLGENSSSVVNLSGTITNTGTLNLKGVLTADANGSYDLAHAGNEVSYSNGENGFMTSTGSEFYLAKGGTIHLGEGYTFYYNDSQQTLTETAEGVTFSTGSTTTSQYYVRSGSVSESGLLGNADSQVTGNTVYVLEGGTLKAAGDISNNRLHYTSGGLNVSEGHTLTIDTATNDVTALIQNTRGEGNINIGSGVTVTLGDSSGTNSATRITGDLIVSRGATLQLGSSNFEDGDTSNNSVSFNDLGSLTLAGGTVRYRGSATELKNMTVSADSTFNLYDMTTPNGSNGNVYATSGQGNFFTIKTMDLANSSTLDVTTAWKYGLNIKALTGNGNLRLNQQSHDSQRVNLTVATGYTGKILLEGGTNMHVTISVDAGASAQVKGKNVNNHTTTIESLTLGTGSTLTLNTEGANNAGGRTFALTAVTVAGAAAIRIGNNNAYQGLVTIEGLSNAANSDTGILTLSANANTSQRSIFNLNGGSFTGTINVEQENNDATSRKVALNINHATAAQNAVIDLSAVKGSVALGIGVDEVTVKGITGAMGSSINTGTGSILSGAQASGTGAFSGDGTTRTLIVDTAGGNYSTSATLGGNLNITKKGEGSQTFASAAPEAIEKVTIEGGSLAFAALAELRITDLVISSGAELHVGSTVQTAAEGANVFSGVRVTNSATLEGGSTLSGGLDLTSTQTLTVNRTGEGSIALGGGLILPAGGGITLSGDILGALASLGTGKSLELFTGVTSLTLGSDTYQLGTELSATAATDLTNYFNITNVEAGSYMLGYTGGGVVYIQSNIPEPATATLSLLALAALAARRRRK